MYATLLADARFHDLLLAIDRDLADAARAEGCLCGGCLHSARYARKPRGRLSRLGPEHDRRFSFCCAVDGCRLRATPPSLRFLGRKVYVAAIVVLIAILQHGISDKRLGRLAQVVSVTLRILADRLEAKRDVKVGIVSRPQSGLSDFYREMGDLFGVELAPHNRWAGAKVLRDRWQAHIDAALSRPVLIVDEAQEMKAAVLAELRLLSSARLDSHILLTIVLAGDGRLLERLRSDELSPLGSRMRVRLAIERSTPDELIELLVHALQKAGAAKLMTPELIATLADHAQGNPRALMNIAGELLDVAAQCEARHIDEKMFLEMCAMPAAPEPKTARQRR